MSETFTVTSTGNQNEWEGAHGRMVDFWLAANDENGNSHWCFTTRKPTSAAPGVGDAIYGHLEEKETKKGKKIYKLVKDQHPGPRGGDVAASPSQQQATPGSVTPKTADRGDNYWDERSARIERQHSQEMALRWWGLSGANGAPALAGELEKVIDWFCADLNTSPTTPHTHTSPQVPQAEVGVGEASSTPQGEASSAPAEATTAQKRKVTQELNNHVAPAYHDPLRTAAEAHTKKGASELIDGLQKMDAGRLLTRYGITPPSDVPADTEGLPPADPEIEALAASNDDDGIPF